MTSEILNLNTTTHQISKEIVSSSIKITTITSQAFTEKTPLIDVTSLKNRIDNLRNEKHLLIMASALLTVAIACAILGLVFPPIFIPMFICFSLYGLVGTCWFLKNWCQKIQIDCLKKSLEKTALEHPKEAQKAASLVTKEIESHTQSLQALSSSLIQYPHNLSQLNQEIEEIKIWQELLTLVSKH